MGYTRNIVLEFSSDAQAILRTVTDEASRNL
jgi:hypothetical protein